MSLKEPSGRRLVRTGDRKGHFATHYDVEKLLRIMMIERQKRKIAPTIRSSQVGGGRACGQGHQGRSGTPRPSQGDAGIDATLRFPRSSHRFPLLSADAQARETRRRRPSPARLTFFLNLPHRVYRNYKNKGIRNTPDQAPGHLTKFTPNEPCHRFRIPSLGGLPAGDGPHLPSRASRPPTRQPSGSELRCFQRVAKENRDRWR